MRRAALASLAIVAILATPASSASLLSVANNYIGWHEAKNGAALKRLLGVNPRRLPWCGAFLAAMARQAGKRLPPAPFLSSSWHRYGKPVKLSHAAPGDVLIMPHHVSIFSRRIGGTICGIGGNQKNRVQESCYPARKVRAVRR